MKIVRLGGSSRPPAFLPVVPLARRAGTRTAVLAASTFDAGEEVNWTIQTQPGKARRADGRTAVHAVDRITSYEKPHFPRQEVYGARGRPESRLITCGGTYDRRKGYSGSVVVFAHLTGIR
ncbi:hypothetical protein ABTZ58_30930 [Streptomyces sp. NPDC094143]|uniref:hypothetical protein n=1 Tax=Streptomyces sp. NPDC094143 TaxID=3155310 RepID=UPI0033338314